MFDSNEALSERELEILQLVATGAANKEIARQLLISPNTVKVHMRNIFAKTGVTSRTEATLYAIQIGLINPGGQAPVDAALLDHSSDEGELASRAETINGEYHLSEVPPLKPGLTLNSLTRFQGQRSSLQLILFAVFVLLFTSSIVLATRWLLPARTSRQPDNSLIIAGTATPATRWTSRAALPAARKGMGAVEYNNSFYLIGGETASGPDGSLHRYSPLDDSWQTLTPKPIPVTDVQAALIGERIYVPGGRTADGSDSAVLEVYDPREDSWSQLAPLPVPVSAYALAAFEGHLYLFGGKSGEQYPTSVYEYVPGEDRWQARTRLRSPLAYAGAAVVGNRIFLIGGFDGKQALDSNLAYHPARDNNGETPWEEFTSLPAGRYAIAITTLSNVIYIAGGQDNDQLPAAPVTLQYLPQANQWASYDSPAVVLGAHGVMLPSEGFLHYLGGGAGEELANLHQSFQALYYNAIPLIQKDK